MIDILYVSYNRLAYVQQTFPALLANTDWDEVGKLYIADDASQDGTAGYLREQLRNAPVDYLVNGGRFGGPVAAGQSDSTGLGGGSEDENPADDQAALAPSAAISGIAA